LDAGPLPDPFAWPDGRRVRTPSEWPARAVAWRDQIMDLEYGGLPPKPVLVEFESLTRSQVMPWPGQPRLWSYRIHCHGGAKPFSFTAKILYPDAPGPFPVILTGDACWWYVSDAVAQKVLAGGCALMQFNRCEMASDLGDASEPEAAIRTGGLYDVYPGLDFGALSAWAWGYHRCVDLLMQLPFVRPDRIALCGHSRGGKTVLLAGATDPRVGLVNDNASCAGGGALFRYIGHGGESLTILDRFPNWFGPGLRPYLGREADLPFDQHCLLACLAPRPLLLTYALGDRWSNPEGMVRCAQAAGEVYRFLGAENALAFHLRPGTHTHSPADWDSLLDFIGWQWLGRSPAIAYNRNPYPHLPASFPWQAP
jgi:hypothetical protein